MHFVTCVAWSLVFGLLIVVWHQLGDLSLDLETLMVLCLLQPYHKFQPRTILLHVHISFYECLYYGWVTVLCICCDFKCCGKVSPLLDPLCKQGEGSSFVWLWATLFMITVCGFPVQQVTCVSFVETCGSSTFLFFLDRVWLFLLRYGFTFDYFRFFVSTFG